MKRRGNIAFTGLVIAIMTTSAGGYYLSMNKTNLEDVDTLERLVSQHYLLPENEEPALATIEDKTRLNSEFLRAAEDGDKLLIYKEAKKVLLYRPSIDRIVEVGPISIAPAAQQ